MSWIPKQLTITSNPGFHSLIVPFVNFPDPIEEFVIAHASACLQLFRPICIPSVKRLLTCLHLLLRFSISLRYHLRIKTQIPCTQHNINLAPFPSSEPLRNFYVRFIPVRFQEMRWIRKYLMDKSGRLRASVRPFILLALMHTYVFPIYEHIMTRSICSIRIRNTEYGIRNSYEFIPMKKLEQLLLHVRRLRHTF